MPGRLDQILSTTRQSLPTLQGRRAALEREVERAPSIPTSLRSALRRPTVAVIAELKRRSPSAGSIREDLDPAQRAALYEQHGAAALSVLTDGPFFGGSMEDLRTASDNCSLPILRKDFILDEVQVLEARAAGASAVLLIVRVLGKARLKPLLRYCGDLGLDALVEVHSQSELEIALDSEARIVGINSRDLDTFTIEAEAAWRLLGKVPSETIAVAESGIVRQADVVRVARAGADAVLVGTALSESQAPEELLRELSEVKRHDR
ncbi:MAG: indole-3-glycerol phosphate synthase TrpC [Gemmatimonadales bacterium]